MMGVHPNINLTAGRFPKQGTHHLARVEVCFNYDTSTLFYGSIVRDDAEAPFVTLIAIDDGPVILATECQYHALVAEGFR